MNSVWRQLYFHLCSDGSINVWWFGCFIRTPSALQAKNLVDRASCAYRSWSLRHALTEGRLRRHSGKLKMVRDRTCFRGHARETDVPAPRGAAKPQRRFGFFSFSRTAVLFERQSRGSERMCFKVMLGLGRTTPTHSEYLSCGFSAGRAAASSVLSYLQVFQPQHY